MNVTKHRAHHSVHADNRTGYSRHSRKTNRPVFQPVWGFSNSILWNNNISCVFRLQPGSGWLRLLSLQPSDAMDFECLIPDEVALTLRNSSPRHVGQPQLGPARPRKTGPFCPRKTDITVGYCVNSEILKLEVVYWTCSAHVATSTKTKLSYKNNACRLIMAISAGFVEMDMRSVLVSQH